MKTIFKGKKYYNTDAIYLVNSEGGTPDLDS